MDTFTSTKRKPKPALFIEVSHDEAMDMLRLIEDEWPLIFDHGEVLERFLRKGGDHFKLMRLAKLAVKLLHCVDRPGSALCNGWDDRLKLANKLNEQWNKGLSDLQD